MNKKQKLTHSFDSDNDDKNIILLKDNSECKNKNNNNNNDNNDRVIIIPILIQKYILEMVYDDPNTISHFIEFNARERDVPYCDPRRRGPYHYPSITKFYSYALVNWEWFKMCQKFISNHIQLLYNQHANSGLFIDDSNIRNKYIILNNQVVKKLYISIFDINSDLVNEINKFHSLESITIVTYFNYDGYICGYSLWLLYHLNNLRDDIIVNLDLDLTCSNTEEEMRENQEKTLTFKTNEFTLRHQYLEDEDLEYSFIYTDIISKLKFKSIIIISESFSDSAPNLHTLEIRLQFHFLSEVYTTTKKNNNNHCIDDKTILNFEDLDNFDFVPLDRNYEVKNDINYYIENGINEDNQIYCAYSVQYDANTSIPPYSMQLWNECLTLLKNNTSITKLSIYTEGCYGCDKDYTDTLNKDFLNDFIDALINNSTIKSLSLDFGYLHDEILHFLESKIQNIPHNQNSTLEYLKNTFKNNNYNNISF